jgi:hypothetical protein
MGFNLASLNTFTLEDSGILISKAVLGADLMQYLDVRPGYPTATVSVNVLGMTAGFAAAACGWTSAGSTNFTQIEVDNAKYSWKQSLCLNELNQYWLSTSLDASAYGERLPFEQQIADQMIAETKKYAESILGNQIISQLTVANGAVAGPTGAWNSTNAYDKAIASIDALPLAVADRDDIIMAMSYANFRYLNTSLISKNLFHYNTGNPVQAGLGQSIIIPGTNVRAIPVGGLGTSPKVYTFPAKHAIVTCGLVDDTNRISGWWSQDNQEIRMISEFNMGVGIIASEAVYTAGA